MYGDEKYDDLIRQFEEMLKTNENYFFDVEEFLDIIDGYISLANYNMADKAIEISLSQYPENIDILLYKAELFSLQDKLSKAEVIIKKLKQINAERIEIPMLEAEIYSRKHMHYEAVRALQDALKLPDSNKAEIFEMITVEYMYMEDYQQALQAALKSLQYDDENTMSLYNAVTCYDLLDKHDQAIAFLQNFLQKNPFNEVAWSLLGKKFIDKEEYQKAIDALDYAIAIDDSFLGAYYDKAYAYAQLKLYEQALEFYKLTLEISDPTAFTYYHIARIYEFLNEENKAIKNYLLAIHEDPGHYKSWIKLVQIKIRQKDYNQALELVQKALEVINNQELFELLGEIYWLKKDLLKSIPAYEMSLKLGAGRLPVILKLADLYKQTGELEKFRSLLLEARKQFPDSKEIKNLMQGN